MRKFVLSAGALFLAAFAAAPALAASDPGVAATVKAFGDAFNKGDMKAAKALHTASPSIQDEFPPFAWKSFDQWGADLSKFEAAEGVSGDKMTVGAPTREEIAGDYAYVIAPATLTFQQKGQTMRETARVTFILAREAGAWKIAGWTWTAAVAKSVK
jgi:hypothetical protein